MPRPICGDEDHTRLPWNRGPNPPTTSSVPRKSCGASFKAAVLAACLAAAGAPASLAATRPHDAEVQINLCSGVEETAQALHLQPVAAERYEVWYFDTADTALFRNGVVVRVRIKGRSNHPANRPLRQRNPSHSIRREYHGSLAKRLQHHVHVHIGFRRSSSGKHAHRRRGNGEPIEQWLVCHYVVGSGNFHGQQCKWSERERAERDRNFLSYLWSGFDCGSTVIGVEWHRNW